MEKKSEDTEAERGFKKKKKLENPSLFSSSKKSSHYA